jgi:membrane associated rhomboid family serine protease
MSFLWQTSRLGCLQRFQLQPVARRLVRNPQSRAICTNTPQLNQRVYKPALQQLRRPFSTSIARRKEQRATRVRAQQKPQKYDEVDTHTPPSAPPRPSRSFNSPNIVVGGLVGACIGMFIYNSYVSGSLRTNPSSEAIAKQMWLNDNFIHSVRNMEEGRYYTIVTSAFMHSSLPHLAFNMLGLWGFGRTIVSCFGTPSFLVLYFGSVVAGGLLQNYMWMRRKQWNHGGLGASGGVLGVFAATACWMPYGTVGFLFVPMPMWIGAALTVGISVGGMQDPPLWMPTFGHADHLGGMAFGALWWLIAMRRGRLPRR